MKGLLAGLRAVVTPSRWRPSLIGRHITLSDEGEGWFDGYADIDATVEAGIGSDGAGNACYVVRFESSLELQEAGAATPSGLALKQYAHGVIHCRWRDDAINVATPVSVHVLLVPAGTAVPRQMADAASMERRAWASCIVTHRRARLDDAPVTGVPR